jgi:hypothetical protein
MTIEERGSLDAAPEVDPSLMDRRYDAAVAFAAALIGTIIVITAQQLPAGSIRDSVGTAAMATGVGSLMAIGGLALAIRRLIGGRTAGVLVPHEGSSDLERYPASFARVLWVWGACLLYTLLLPWVGFAFLTPLLIAGLLWLLQFRRPRPVLIISFVATLFFYLLFDVLLLVRFPHGLLTGII